MPQMTFEEAKAELIDQAVGTNDYETISTWGEIAEAAASESTWAMDKASRLQSLLNLADGIINDSSQDTES